MDPDLDLGPDLDLDLDLDLGPILNLHLWTCSHGPRPRSTLGPTRPTLHFQI